MSFVYQQKPDERIFDLYSKLIAVSSPLETNDKRITALDNTSISHQCSVQVLLCRYVFVSRIVQKVIMIFYIDYACNGEPSNSEASDRTEIHCHLYLKNFILCDSSLDFFICRQPFMNFSSFAGNFVCRWSKMGFEVRPPKAFSHRACFPWHFLTLNCK